MIDVMQHKLVSSRAVDFADQVEGSHDAYMAYVGRGMAAGMGLAIFDRYPPDVTENADTQQTIITHEVYVFDPKELAAFVAQVREQTIDEVLAVADSLDTTEQENHDEQ